jgi:hypothetical protein
MCQHTHTHTLLNPQNEAHLISSHILIITQQPPLLAFKCISPTHILECLPTMCMLLNLRIGLSLYAIPKQTPQELEDPKDYRLH